MEFSSSRLFDSRTAVTEAIAREMRVGMTSLNTQHASDFSRLLSLVAQEAGVHGVVLSLFCGKQDLVVAQRGIALSDAPCALPHDSRFEKWLEGEEKTRYAALDEPEKRQSVLGLQLHDAVTGEQSNPAACAVAGVCRTDGTLVGALSVFFSTQVVLSEEQAKRLADYAAIAGQLLNAERLSHDLQALRQTASIAEQRLSEAVRHNSQLSAAVHNAATGVVMSDPNLTDNPIVFANPAFYRMTGYMEDEVLGRNCRFLQGEATDAETVQGIREAVKEGRNCHCTLINYRKDGTPFWNNLIISPVFDEKGRLCNFVGIQNDVTAAMEKEAAITRAKDELELRVQTRTADLARVVAALEKINQTLEDEVGQHLKSKTELEQSRQQLRALAAHQESAQEQERTRIAREIHDELGQLLTGIKMELAWVERRLSEREEAVPGQNEPTLHAVVSQTASAEDLRERLQNMAQQIDLSIQSVRRIAADLRPAVLDRFGLKEALEWQAQEFQKRVGIRCSCSCDVEEGVVGKEQATALFRIAQEALTNIARHANATRASISLHRIDGFLVLEVRDNGVGVAKTENEATFSLGIIGMRERAYLLGGEFSLKSRRGTTVKVRLPLEEAQT